jgi:urease accessory protein
VLVAEDGSMVRVVAAPQAVLVIRPDPHHGSPFDLVRAAWHLGSRHVAIELDADHLKIQADHDIALLLRGMHLVVEDTFAPFEPEGGAEAAHAGHDHDHSHAHRHAHDHDHEHDTQVHDHEHDSREHGDHGATAA